jgi:hypothetical protein
MNGLFALMWSLMRAAALWVIDGTNSDGQRRSTNRWTAAKPYRMMDHPLNQLFVWVWVKVRWSIIGGDVISRDECRKSDARGIMVLRSGKLMGPKRQPAYLWNAESMLYKICMGLVRGFHCKRYENNL